jgi:hypothetical protein
MRREQDILDYARTLAGFAIGQFRTVINIKRSRTVGALLGSNQLENFETQSKLRVNYLHFDFQEHCDYSGSGMGKAEAFLQT